MRSEGMGTKLVGYGSGRLLSSRVRSGWVGYHNYSGCLIG